MNILQQCQQWHEEEQHQQIIDALEVVAESERGYELTSMLARAYNNIAQPEMDNYRELLERALALLQSVEMDGLTDPLWHFRIGYSLFFLGREPEALAHFELAALSIFLPGLFVSSVQAAQSAGFTHGCATPFTQPFCC